MAKFCPNCGKPTVKQDVVGRVRDICEEGHFIQFATYNNSAAGLVFRDNSVLLVQHNHPTKVWSLPGGYIEQEEDLVLGLKREVKEESGIDVEPVGIIALRNLVKETLNELYIIFLCEADNEYQPSSQDLDEILDAKFIPLTDIPDWNITPFTRRIIEGYLENKPEPMREFTIENYYPEAFMFGDV